MKNAESKFIIWLKSVFYKSNLLNNYRTPYYQIQLLTNIPSSVYIYDKPQCRQEVHSGRIPQEWCSSALQKNRRNKQT